MESFVVSFWRCFLFFALTSSVVACSEPPTEASESPAHRPASFPMPRADFFSRLEQPLVKSCDTSVERYNLPKERCIALIAQRTFSCANQVSVPASIQDKSQFKTIAREYLECATPYFFCHGVEVKAEAAMNACR